MNTEIRHSGIAPIGGVPWGSHFCQFYETKQDLIDTLVPYFKAGLVNNEFCMWITADNLTADEARAAISKALPEFAALEQKGQIEILPYDTWYLKNGAFDSQRVLDAWVEKTKRALENGYQGLRLSGNTFWLEKQLWRDFTDYEAAVNNVIGKYKMIALCTYALEKCTAVEIVDVIRNHEFALIKQSGQWEIFDNSRYKNTKEALATSQKRLNDLYRSMREGFARHELVYDEYGKAIDYIILDVNSAYEQITNLTAAGIIGRKASEVYGTGSPPYLEIFAPVAETGEAVVFETYFPPMEKHFSVSVFSADRGFFATIFSDITKRKQDEQKLIEQATMLANVADAVIAYDADSRIIYWNKGAEKMYGYTAAEALGKSGRDLFKPVYIGTTREELVNQVNRDGHLEMTSGRTTKNGRTIIVETHVIARKDDDGKVTEYVVIDRDITARRRAEESLIKINRELQAISECNKAVVHARDEQGLLTDVCRVMCEVVGYRMAWVGAVEHDEAKSVRPVASWGDATGYLEAADITWADTERGRGPSGVAIRTGKTDFCQDFATDPRATPWRENAIARGFRSSIAIPFLTNTGNVFAVLCLYAAVPDGFTPDEVGLLEELAIDLAFGVMTLRLRQARDKAEAELRETSAYLNNLFNYANAPIIVWGPDYRITRFNHAFERLTGRTAADVIGRHLEILFPENERAHAMEHIRDASTGLRMETEEITIARVDGTVRTVLWNSANIYDNNEIKIISTMAQGQDITERKRLEDRLSYLSSFPELNPMQVLEIDLNGNVRYCNPTTRRLFPDIVEQGIEHPYLTGLRKLLSAKLKPEMKKVRQIKVGNRYFEQVMNLVGGGQYLRIYAHDITKRKKTQQALTKKRAAEYEELKKMDQLKDDFIGLVSHELRTPITIILGALDAVLTGNTVLSAKQNRQLLSDAYWETDELSSILNNLLELARAQADSLKITEEPVVVYDAIKSVVKRIKLQSLTHKITVKCDRKLSVLADRIRVEQILRNLIQNAIKYSPPSTSINIFVTADKREITIGIRDQGPGISQANQKRLFRPFERLSPKKDAIPGTGLGLVVCERLVTAQHGRIWVKSAPGQGSTFYFTLPLISIGR